MGFERSQRYTKVALFSFFITVLAACTSGSEEGSSDTRSAFEISGSIGDGPIVDADIVVVDANGVEIATGQSNERAEYTIEIPAGAALPVTVRVSGGTDLVTQRAADFELVSQVNATGTQTINVSPLTTLAVKTAECSGDSSTDGVDGAWNDLADQLNAGLDRSALGDPLADPIDATNIETAVLANEALGEVIRRTGAALPDVDLEQVVDVLACDLADGQLDGALAQAVTDDDTRVFAVMKAVEAAVRIEVLMGELKVDGVDATGAMNSATRTVMPELTDADVNSVELDATGIDGARNALLLLSGIYADDTLTDLVEVLNGSSPADVRSRLANAVNAADENTLTGLADRVAVADTTEIDDIAERADEQNTALAPIVSLAADPTTVAVGAGSVLSWSSSNAEICTASWADDEVALEGVANTGALQQTTQKGQIKIL